MAFLIYESVKDRLHALIASVMTTAKSNLAIYSYKLEGAEYVCYGRRRFDFPKNFLALSRYIKENKLCPRFRQIYSFRQDASDYRGDIDYIIDYDKPHTIQITDTLHVTISSTRGKKEDNNDVKDYINVCVELQSTVNISEIIVFLEKCTYQYEQHQSNVNKNILFHFVYHGCRDGKLQFCKQVISDLNSDTRRSYETFDNIFNEHRDKLKNDIDRLRNIEYYKKTGLKRKKGYLFYGHPGCGKTSTVMAMANYDNRHIIEVPISRLKSSEEFEQLLSMTEIDGVKFTSNQIIILFDEIDKDYDGTVTLPSQKLTAEDGGAITLLPPPPPPALPLKPQKTFSLGCFLSRLDGIGSYNGIIFIATANSIAKFDAALYRDGRLDLVTFDYIRQIDIVNMIEKYYGIKLDEESHIKLLPDRSCMISPITVRNMIESAKDCATLIRDLHEMTHPQ